MPDVSNTLEPRPSGSLGYLLGGSFSLLIIHIYWRHGGKCTQQLLFYLYTFPCVPIPFQRCHEDLQYFLGISQRVFSDNRQNITVRDSARFKNKLMKDMVYF
jgi:hypothetical protein